jgi:diguanylate cyclase (GGDEF)-like protein/PAS domain S-box-containing protein
MKTFFEYKVGKKMQKDKELKNLKTILNNSPDIIVLKDAKGKWLETNTRTLEIFGIDDNLYKGKDEHELAEFYPEFREYVPYFIESDRRAWEFRGQIHAEETIYVNGEERIFDVVKIPTFDPEGNPETLLVVGRDITEKLIGERVYTSIFNQHLDAVYSLDINGKFLDVNNVAEEISGYTKEELLKMDFTSLIAVEFLPEVLSSYEKVTEGIAQNRELKIVRKDGTKRDVRLTTIPAILKGRVVGIHGIAQDISIEKRTEALREKQTEILALIAEGNSLDSILQHIVPALESQISDSYCSVLFYHEAEKVLKVAYAPHLDETFIKKIKSIPIELYYGSCGHASFTKKLTTLSDIGSSDVFWKEWREEVLRLGYKTSWSMPIFSTKNELLGTLGVFCKEIREPNEYEISIIKAFSYLTGLAIERSKHEEEIRFLAYHDALTNLPNIRFLKDTYNKLIKQTRDVALMFLDLDQFKYINDTFGHNLGDLVLKEVASRIKTVIGEDNIVARMGGDEFVVLLKGIDQKEKANRISHSILNAIHEPITIQNTEFFITGSIGISFYSQEMESIDHLMKCADVAMYNAKGLGGNTSQEYDLNMERASLESFALQGEFRKALNNNEFHLYYQPKINVQTNEVSSLEALIRWDHPERGLISPALFIPIAEENGFITELGSWVIKEACRQMKEWRIRENLNIKVSVNVSVRQFLQQDVAQLVIRSIEENQISPDCFEIEITESVLVKHEHIIQHTIKKLQQYGVKISIDDFGTGYASLMYLKQFCADEIKIDRSFIKLLPHNKEDAGIVSAIITLAQVLNLEVVAEGVETEEQLNFLKEKGNIVVQGYLYSPPVPANEIVPYIREKNK